MCVQNRNARSLCVCGPGIPHALGVVNLFTESETNRQIASFQIHLLNRQVLSETTPEMACLREMRKLKLCCRTKPIHC